MINKLLSTAALGFCLALCIPVTTRAQAGRNPASSVRKDVPPPENDLGFKIGTDRKLATWDRFVAYFEHLAAGSNRLKVENLGKTTEGRPFLVVTISAPENMAKLEEFKTIQKKLADPRLINSDQKAANELIARGRNVVVITCSIHSTEVGGTLTATQLAYRLASEDSPEILQILENNIILLVPSLNPDGTDIVAKWYQKTLGTPAEGTEPPELYHHYTGHDNNRDWYAFTQVETQMTVDKVLNVWHPTILHDIHQQGAFAARLYVPPYVEPWEPNIDPAIIAGVSALGSSIAFDLIAQGKKGISIASTYDAWTPSRAYAHYHGALRILSETASARLATPIEVPFSSLVAGIGYHSAVKSWNFPSLWMGGKWGIGDIVAYQTAAAMALLHSAAKERERYLSNFWAINSRAVAGSKDVFAYLLPEPELPKSLAEDEKRLALAGKDKQGSSTGEPATEKDHEARDAEVKKALSGPASSEEVGYYYQIEGLDRALGILKRAGVEVMNAGAEFTAGGKSFPKGTHIIYMNQPYESFAKTMLEVQKYPDLREYPGGPPRKPYDVTAHTLPLLMNFTAIPIKEPFKATAKREPLELVLQARVRSGNGIKVGLYQNYLPSMDEGWTRFVFDKYRFQYVRLKQEDIKSGFLHSRFDVIILPDQSTRALVKGLSGGGRGEEAAEYPPEYRNGLGESGVRALKDFVESGGTLITFNNASNLAIEELGAPLRNVLKGLSDKEFYCPGSILNLELDATSNLTFGMVGRVPAWFEQSPAFEVLDPKAVKVIARYSEKGNPLMSGWILGEEKLSGKAALVEVKMGKGRIVMFGFRPQYRAQSLATIPLLFNAILTSK